MKLDDVFHFITDDWKRTNLFQHLCLKHMIKYLLTYSNAELEMICDCYYINTSLLFASHFKKFHHFRGPSYLLPSSFLSAGSCPRSAIQTRSFSSTSGLQRSRRCEDRTSTWGTSAWTSSSARCPVQTRKNVTITDNKRRNNYNLGYLIQNLVNILFF